MWPRRGARRVEASTSTDVGVGRLCAARSDRAREPAGASPAPGSNCGAVPGLVARRAVSRSELSPADAAVLETFAVPRYLGAFGELALELLLCGESIRLVHLGCRTGFPDLLIAERVPGAQLAGVDSSRTVIELARNKAAARGASIEYRVGDPFQTTFGEGHFSHALCLHPGLGVARRAGLLAEMYRLLYAGGQAVLALPMRGSFQELDDLLREFATKHDRPEVYRAVDAAALARPNVEALSEEFEAAGFDDIDIEVRPSALEFESGRAVREDPAMRLLVVPEYLAQFPPGSDLTEGLAYVWKAMDRYWSEGRLELGVTLGCASARRW